MTARRTASKADKRKTELARIHILKADLGLSDDDYRTMLAVQTGKSSAADLTDRERWRVLDHLSRLTGKDGRRKGYPGRPHNADRGDGRAAQLRKIEALLTSGGKPWAYADALCQRLSRDQLIPFERCAFAPWWLLRKVIAALTYQAKREGRG